MYSPIPTKLSRESYHLNGGVRGVSWIFAGVNTANRANISPDDDDDDETDQLNHQFWNNDTVLCCCFASANMSILFETVNRNEKL